MMSEEGDSTSTTTTVTVEEDDHNTNTNTNTNNAINENDVKGNNNSNENTSSSSSSNNETNNNNNNNNNSNNNNTQIKVKILVCGEVQGDFSSTFKKIEAVNKSSGPFDFILCVGKFFAKGSPSPLKELISGEVIVPLPTYFIAGDPDDVMIMEALGLQSGGSVYQNLYYLSGCGLKEINGLTIAWVSSIIDDSYTQNWKVNSTVKQRDLENLINIIPLEERKSFRGVDILLSNQWPISILKETLSTITPPSQTFPIKLVCESLKPRYHLASGGWYQRKPYRNGLKIGDTNLVSRFISLASVANVSKQRFFYAMGLVPLKSLETIETEPPEATSSPFEVQIPKRQVENNVEPSVSKKQKSVLEGLNQSTENSLIMPRYSHHFEEKKGKKPQDRDNRRQNFQGKGGKDQKKESQAPACWFCLSSPQVEKHLIVSIGEDVYLALPKGGMVPEHILIIPIIHTPYSSLLPTLVQKEINRYKSALQKCFSGEDKTMVFFERYLTYGSKNEVHCHIQGVPVPNSVSHLLAPAFIEEGQKLGMNFETILNGIVLPQQHFFHVELPDKGLLFTTDQKLPRVPIQFGREVIAKVMDLKNRIEWKDCVLEKNVEEKYARQFKEKFKGFDFTS